MAIDISPVIYRSRLITTVNLPLIVGRSGSVLGMPTNLPINSSGILFKSTHRFRSHPYPQAGQLGVCHLTHSTASSAIETFHQLWFICPPPPFWRSRLLRSFFVQQTRWRLLSGTHLYRAFPLPPFSLTDNVGTLVNSLHEIGSKTSSVTMVDSVRERVRDGRLLE